MLQAIEALARVCEPAVLAHVSASVQANIVELTVEIESMTNSSKAFFVATWLEREGWKIKAVDVTEYYRGAVTAIRCK